MYLSNQVVDGNSILLSLCKISEKTSDVDAYTFPSHSFLGPDD